MYHVWYSLNRTQQAWEDARNAQTRGDLHKKPCQSCGTTKNVEAHHSNYDHTTRVRWMCKSCHKKLELKKHSQHDYVLRPMEQFLAKAKHLIVKSPGLKSPNPEFRELHKKRRASWQLLKDPTRYERLDFGEVNRIHGEGNKASSRLHAIRMERLGLREKMDESRIHSRHWKLRDQKALDREAAAKTWRGRSIFTPDWFEIAKTGVKAGAIGAGLVAGGQAIWKDQQERQARKRATYSQHDYVLTPFQRMVAKVKHLVVKNPGLKSPVPEFRALRTKLKDPNKWARLNAEIDQINIQLKRREKSLAREERRIRSPFWRSSAWSKKHADDDFLPKTARPPALSAPNWKNIGKVAGAGAGGGLISGGVLWSSRRRKES